MRLFPISEINAAICAVEGRVTDDEIAARDRQLRHLTQRNPLRPSGREGRADTYTAETACVIFATLVVGDFSLPRHIVSDFAAWLGGDDKFADLLPSTSGGLSRASVIASALKTDGARVEIIRGFDGRIDFWASWWEPGKKLVAAAWSNMRGQPSATLTVEVGALSAALLAHLEA